MKHLFSLIIIVACTTLIAGCGAATEEAALPEPAAAPEVVEPVAELAMVEVTAEGTEYDPPVAIEQIPDGSWYCDMETVHYARTEEGDGACALCEMALVEKITEEVTEEVTEEAVDQANEPTTAG